MAWSRKGCCWGWKQDLHCHRCWAALRNWTLQQPPNRSLGHIGIKRTFDTTSTPSNQQLDPSFSLSDSHTNMYQNLSNPLANETVPRTALQKHSRDSGWQQTNDVVFLNTNTHKNPPWGKGKAGKSARTQSWLSKHTYLFFHKETCIVEWRQHGFIYSTPGGVWQYSQPLNQSSAGHNNTSMYFREQSVGAGISSDAESRNSNLAEPRSVLSSSLYLGLPGLQSSGCPCCTTHIFPASYIVLSLSLLLWVWLVQAISGQFRQSLLTQGHIPFSWDDSHSWGSPQHPLLALPLLP